jgi:hypothetical protein
MESLRPRARSPRAAFAPLLIAGIVAACAVGGAPQSAGPTSAASPTTAPSEAAGTPAPTNLAAVSITLLPVATIDTKAVKVACDAAALGSSVSMSCDDIVKLSARIAATTSANPIKQLAVTKSADNPDAIQVTFWVKAEDADTDTAFTSTIDPANQTVTIPVEDSTAVFPTTS